MKEINIPIHIGPGDLDAYTPITGKELRILRKTLEKMEEGEDVDEFVDNEALSSLYERAIETALDDAANAAADNPFEELGEYDFQTTRDYIQENFEISAEYPDIEELDSL